MFQIIICDFFFLIIINWLFDLINWKFSPTIVNAGDQFLWSGVGDVDPANALSGVTRLEPDADLRVDMALDSHGRAGLVLGTKVKVGINAIVSIFY